MIFILLTCVGPFFPMKFSNFLRFFQICAPNWLFSWVFRSKDLKQSTRIRQFRAAISSFYEKIPDRAATVYRGIGKLAHFSIKGHKLPKVQLADKAWSALIRWRVKSKTSASGKLAGISKSFSTKYTHVQSKLWTVTVGLQEGLHHNL